ncbi:hypothetical protein BDZ89DRAFT_1064406 [Hymenopellis radicata]|nr:hypothetical protein BDZ89DRAFT_1064406 [Hymenopellis radicata]
MTHPTSRLCRAPSFLCHHPANVSCAHHAFLGCVTRLRCPAFPQVLGTRAASRRQPSRSSLASLTRIVHSLAMTRLCCPAFSQMLATRATESPTALGSSPACRLLVRIRWITSAMRDIIVIPRLSLFIPYSCASLLPTPS